MTKNQSVTKNTIYNIITNILIVAFPIMTVPYISRILGPQNLGKFNFIRSLVNYFVTVAGLGIPLYANREIAKIKNNLLYRSKTFFEIEIIRFVTVFFTVIIYYLIIYLFPQIVNNNIKLATILGALIFISLFDINWFFQGIGMFNIVTKALIISKIIYLPLLFYLVKRPSDLYIYSLLIIISDLIYKIYLVFKAKKHISIQILKNQTIKPFSHFQYIGWFFFSQLAVLVYTNLDNVMIGYIQNEEQVGHYFVANRLVKIILSIVTSAGAVLLAKISQLKENSDIEGIKKYIKKSTSIVFLIAIPAIFGLILLSNEIILLVFGSSYNSSLTLKILAPLLIIIALSNIYGIQILLPFNKEKEFSIIIITGAVINFCLNLILIKSIGYNGAAISTLVSETVIAAVDFVLINKIVKGIHNFKVIIQVVFSSLLMSIYVFLVKEFLFAKLGLFIGMFFIIITSIIIYSLLLLLQRNEILIWLFKGKLLKR